MKKLMIAAVSALAFSFSTTAIASTDYAAEVKEEMDALQGFFKKKFPEVEFSDFKNGIYAIDEQSREQWLEIEEFPPYEMIVDKGEELWESKFANGKTYADCFKGELEDIRAQYPHHDEERDSVITLELAINECRKANGEKPFKWKKGEIAYLSSYIAFQGRGKLVNVKVETEKAKAWYDKGRQFFYAKRGQLNMACADCHIYYSGQYARSERLSPTVGHTTGFPVVRTKWTKTDEGIGTLHRRYGGCNENIRAKAFPAQSPEYRALEFYETIMSNGLAYNGPSSRK